jgi:hypothetical protein
MDPVNLNINVLIEKKTIVSENRGGWHIMFTIEHKYVITYDSLF